MLIRRRRTALSKTPHALADGLMLVFEHPAKADHLRLNTERHPPHSIASGGMDRQTSRAISVM